MHGGQRRTTSSGPGRSGPEPGPAEATERADREKLQKSFEACKGKLPEELQKAGPPEIGSVHCGPPPGEAPKQDQNQSDQLGTHSSGTSA